MELHKNSYNLIIYLPTSSKNSIKECMNTGTKKSTLNCSSVNCYSYPNIFHGQTYNFINNIYINVSVFNIRKSVT